MDNTSILDRLKKLVAIESVVNTTGEAVLAKSIYDELKDWPYFQQNPEHLWLQKTDEDQLERYNVIALVKANKPVSNTVVLLGHTDTVGIKDYGPLEELAIKPDELKEAIAKQSNLPAQVQQHLENEDWLFGRGTLDMKSGVAANLTILQDWAERTNEMAGNLMLVAECDEEDSSTGILSVVPLLNKIADEHGLSYSGAINSDFVTSRYEGDPNRYIYLGTVGKLLPSFYVSGKETHVGQSFEGFDPNLVLSELTKEINYNVELADYLDDEWTPPPVSLKQTDLKPYYDVQTPLGGFAYYNFLVHSLSPKDVMTLMKERAIIAFERAIASYRERLEEYKARTGLSLNPTVSEPRVFTYAEYVQYLSNVYGDENIKDIIRKKTDELMKTDVDIRFFCCRIVEELQKWDPSPEPVCITFYSSLYSPRIVLGDKEERERKLQKAVASAVEKIQPKCEHPIVIRKFFPYISDMSFVMLSDDEEGIEGYTSNMPAWGRKHSVPFQEIRKLNLPIVNIGPYGFDAHKKWERLEISYSLEIVPKLIGHVVEELWK